MQNFSQKIFKKYFAYRFGRFLYIYSFARQNAGGVVVFHLLHVCHQVGDAD